MSEKDWKTLTREEVQAELRNLLRESKSEREFKEKCNRRFKGPIIMVSCWDEKDRGAYISTPQWNYSIGARISI